MKKTVYFIICLVFVLSVFTISVFAETDDSATYENTENLESSPAEESENASESEDNAPTTPENNFSEQILGIVTDGATWAKIGTFVLGVLALILGIKKNLSKLTSLVSLIKTRGEHNATNEDLQKALKTAVNDINASAGEEYKKLNAKLEEQTARNDQLTAILTVITLRLIKNPNARTEVMSVLSGTKQIAGDVQQVVETIEKEIEALDASEIKEETPALDAVKATVKESTKAGTLVLG